MIDHTAATLQCRSQITVFALHCSLDQATHKMAAIN